MDACGFENIQVSPSTSTFKICREHFTQNDFEGPTTLRPDAVPSLFTTYSRSLIDKQNLNDPNSSAAKRFRSDMASIRAKQTTPINNMNNKRAQIPYRNNNNNNNNNQYQRQFHPQQNHEQQQQQILSPSPTRESLEETLKQMINETKQLTDMELNMNCMEEQLTETQLAHCPVKVSLTQII